MNEDNFEIEPAIENPSDFRRMLAHARECFTINVPFLEVMGFPLPEPTQDDKKEAMQIYHAGPLAPSKDRKSTRLNSSHIPLSRMPSSA